MILEKIISGGQTGADAGALHAAKELGIATGGYAPRNYKTELGSDFSLKEFGLLEMESTNYNQRTVANIHNSDGTVVFGKLDSPGTKLTIKIASSMRKPLLLNPRSPKEFCDWIIVNRIKILNVAGNRESKNPTIQERVKTFLITALKEDNYGTE